LSGFLAKSLIFALFRKVGGLADVLYGLGNFISVGVSQVSLWSDKVSQQSGGIGL
jgi:hypothetical protein